MSRASNLAKAIGADGTLNVSDVAGLAAVASSGSASDLSTGTLPNARLATGAAVANLGYTPANKAGDTFTGTVLHDLTSGNEQVRWNVNGNIYGRVATANKNDSFNNGGRLFIGDGGVDTILGTANSSQTPTNSYVGLRHNGSVSLRAGSSMLGIDIDTSGRMTNPNQVAFSAYYSGANLSGSQAPVVFNYTRVNRGSGYSTSTGRFTAPVAGAYLIGATNNMAGSNGADMLLRVNGGNIVGVEFDVTTSTSYWLGLSCQSIVSLAAGDYVDVIVGGGTYSVEVVPWNSFYGFLIG